MKLQGKWPNSCIHGNTRKVPHNALSISSTQFFKFVFNYAEQHALLLPGRVPRYSCSGLHLLPSSVSKRGIWSKRSHSPCCIHHPLHSREKFNTICHCRSHDPTFVDNVNKTAQLLYIQQTIPRPTTQLHTPMHWSTFILLGWRGSTTSPSAMRERSCSIYHCWHVHTTATMLTHIKQLKGHQGALFVRVCAADALSIRSDAAWPHLLPCTSEVHSVWGGLAPQKCTVFGVACEALSRQINFLTDKAGDCDKVANAVVSRMHYFFDHHGFGERDVYLHAHKCTGLNNNSCMMQYFAWHTLTNRRTNITLSLLPVNHTKFAPDRSFGLFKHAYRWTKEGSLQSIACVVNTSAECTLLS